MASGAMQAGALDRQVSLQSVTTSADSYGQGTPTWATVDTVWAAKRGLGSIEFFAAAQTQMQDSVKYVIRYRSDVTQTWRLVDGSDEFDIVGLREIGRREWLELTCRGGVKDGR